MWAEKYEAREEGAEHLHEYDGLFREWVTGERRDWGKALLVPVSTHLSHGHR